MDTAMHRTADGFITADDTEFMARVAQRINASAPELDAAVTHTGGGIFCIACTLPDGTAMLWGVADGVWGYEFNDSEGDLLDGGGFTELPTASTDEETVARAILGAADGHIRN